MSNLLLDDQPLVISPSLAKLIGLNEAIFLQQLHYWLQKSMHNIEERKWVYNTFQAWQEQFPFWGVNTIKRIVEKLEQTGILLTANYNSSKIDRTKWYSIDYEKLSQITTAQNGTMDAENSSSSAQNGTMDDPKWADHCPNLGRPIPEITSEITSEKNQEEEEEEKHAARNPFVFYEQNIMPTIKPMIREEILFWLNGNFFEEPEVIIVEAMKLAVRKDTRSKWDYANKVLIDWSERKLKTLDAIRTYIKEFGQQKASSSPVTPRNSRSNVRHVDKLPDSVQKQIEREKERQHNQNISRENTKKTIMDDPELAELYRSLRETQVS